MSADFSKYKEIICIAISGISAVRYMVHIPKIVLNSNEHKFIMPGGAYKSDYMTQRYVVVKASLSTVKIVEALETTVS